MPARSKAQYRYFQNIVAGLVPNAKLTVAQAQEHLDNTPDFESLPERSPGAKAKGPSTDPTWGM